MKADFIVIPTEINKSKINLIGILIQVLQNINYYSTLGKVRVLFVFRSWK